MHWKLLIMGLYLSVKSKIEWCLQQTVQTIGKPEQKDSTSKYQSMFYETTQDSNIDSLEKKKKEKQKKKQK